MHAHEPPSPEEWRRPAPARAPEPTQPWRVPGRLTPAALPGLQRAAGNAAVTRLVEARRHRPAPPAHGPVQVQRNVGIELEETTWGVTQDGHKVDKGVPVVHRPFFQLQAEYAGDQASNIEIVTNRPGVVDDTEWRAMRDGVVNLGDELRGRVKGQPFSAAELAGGDGRYQLRPGYQFKPFLQVTAGVPLAAIPALFRALKGKAQFTAPGLGDVKAIASRLRGAPEEGSSSAEPEGKGKQKAEEEPESAPVDPARLLGFITMVRSYLMEGNLGTNSQTMVTFLKGLTKVMARTDFAAMFMLLSPEERQLINQDKDAWVAAMVEGLDGGAKAPVLGQVAHDPMSGANAMRLNTSRREWLTEMMSTGEGAEERAGRDVLSVRGKLAGPDPDPTGPPEQEEARKLAVGIDEARGTEKQLGLKADKLDFTAVQKGLAELDDGLDKLVDQLKDLHEGFGALGDVYDQVQYEGEDEPTGAVIVEIRNPTNSDWTAAMDEIYAAVHSAIGDNGERPYTSVLSSKGQKARTEADQQRRAVEAQPRVGGGGDALPAVGGPLPAPHPRVGPLRWIAGKIRGAIRLLTSCFN